MSDRARREIVQIETAQIDYMAGISSAEKKLRLSRMSYEAFLRDVVKVDPAVNAYYHATTMGEWGVGTDAVSALDCWGYGMPGFQGMKLAKGSTPRMGPTPAGYEDTGGSYKLHFPDGNATIARLLVRDLIPQTFGGRGHAAERRGRYRHGASRLFAARSSRRAGPAAPEQHRRSRTPSREPPWAASDVEVTYMRSGVALCGAGAGRGARVLQHDDPLSMPGAAARAEGGACTAW